MKVAFVDRNKSTVYLTNKDCSECKRPMKNHLLIINRFDGTTRLRVYNQQKPSKLCFEDTGKI